MSNNNNNNSNDGDDDYNSNNNKNEKDVDHQMTNQWLKSGGLKSETEGFTIAAQDRVIKTNYYRRNILNDGTDPMCRICGQSQETIDHIVAGSPELAKTEYLHRHDKAA